MVKELIDLVWEGKFNPKEVFYKIQQYIENPAYSQFPKEKLTFNYQGEVFSLPWYDEIPPGVQEFCFQEEAKMFAKYGRRPYEGRYILSTRECPLFKVQKMEESNELLKRLSNTLDISVGETRIISVDFCEYEILVVERAIFEFRGKFYLDEKFLADKRHLRFFTDGDCGYLIVKEITKELKDSLIQIFQLK